MSGDIQNGCKCRWCREKWVDHDAKIYPMWKNQHKWNDDMQTRVRWIEAKVFLAVGAASVLGNLIVYWLLK